MHWNGRGVARCNATEAGDLRWLGAPEDDEGDDDEGDVSGAANLLVFDLVADPAESKNLSLPAEQIAHFNAVRDAVLRSVNSTFRSTPDYSQGTTKEEMPCCDVDHVVCRCSTPNARRADSETDST